MIDMTMELMDGVGVLNGVGVSAVGAPMPAAMKNAAAVPVSGLAPDPEVHEVKRKRIRKLEDKLRIVREFDGCSSAGERGALLRREGIYASYVHRWRYDLDQRTLFGLSNHKRGPKADPARKEKLRIIELEKQLLRTEKDLKKAHIIIDVQKKLSEILGIALPPVEDMPS